MFCSLFRRVHPPLRLRNWLSRYTSASNILPFLLFYCFVHQTFLLSSPFTMINPLSAVMIVTGIRHVLSAAVSPHFSAANPEAGWPSEDINGTPPIISGGLRLR